MKRNGQSATTYTLLYTLTQIFSGGKAKINLHTMLKLTVLMPISCRMRSRRHFIFFELHDIIVRVIVHVIV